MSRVRREDITVRVVKRGSAEDVPPPAPPTAAERLDLVASLSVQTWELTGKPLPELRRGDLPIVVRSLKAEEDLGPPG